MADNDSGKKRQAIVGILLAAVVGFMGWQLFGGKKSDGAASTAQTAANTPPPSPMPTPKPADIAAKPAAPLTPREMQMMQAQQELEARYLDAINELQMLKIQRDIAETTKAIASAKLDTVSSEKNIVNLLAPAQDTNYSQRLANTQGTATNDNNGAPVSGGQAPITAELSYTVISVSEIQGRWGAVLGVGGKLYSVHIGDTMPNDTSKVTSIDRSGVVLEKDGVKKTISLVPII